jgi:hypothetical protein
VIARKLADHSDVALNDQNQMANSLPGDFSGSCRNPRIRRSRARALDRAEILHGGPNYDLVDL